MLSSVVGSHACTGRTVYLPLDHAVTGMRRLLRPGRRQRAGRDESQAAFERLHGSSNPEVYDLHLPVRRGDSEDRRMTSTVDCRMV